MKTIKDIAREANTSPGTVDRVLHNREGVSQKTRERIQTVLDKYDFQKNILASMLAFKKKHRIAVLIPEAQSDKEFWYEPNRGVKTALKEIKKYGVTVTCFYFNQFNPQSFVDAFKKVVNFEPNAVLLSPIFYNNSIHLVGLLEEKDIPYAFINIDIEGQKNIAFIGQNSYQSGFLSGKILNLIMAEEEEVLLIKSRKSIDSHHAIDARVKGFLDYFKGKNSIRSIHFLNIENFDITESIKCITKELENNQIKGIFVPSSYVYKVAEILQKTNLNSVKLLGYDVHSENTKYLKKETIDFLIDQEPFEQGYTGIKILFEYLLFQEIPKKIYNSPINIITAENLDFRENYFENVLP
ncbi:MAG: substrate-binding domain-containing protein [Cellulophaga sp.]